MLHLIVTLIVALEAPAAARPGLPDDARLDPVRPRLERIVGDAAGAGLPADLIVNKVREGLAKGVDPARIEAAALRLSDSLQAAQRYVASRRPGGAPGLVRPVAEARLAGVALTSIDPLVAAERPEPPARRAVEVVTDLALRGYPPERAAAVVRDVLARDSGALDRLPGTLEGLRRDYALSRLEAVDALARGLASSDSLQTAITRTTDDERRQGHGRGASGSSPGHGGDSGEGGSPGKSGLAPGHLGKMKPPTAGPKKK
jgi:hypothetical protein